MSDICYYDPWQLLPQRYVSSAIPDDPELQGVAVTPRRLASVRERRDLVSLIPKMVVESLALSFDHNGKISTDTANAAIALIKCIDPDGNLPTISPDGDGGLMLVWSSGARKAITIVDGWKIHLVDNANSHQATYKDDIPFDGENIPSAVRSALGPISSVA